MPWETIVNFFTTVIRSIMTPVGLTILSLGFIAGLTPYLATMTQQQQPQQTDMPAMMAQLLQTLIPVMLITMIFRMMMGTFTGITGERTW